MDQKELATRFDDILLKISYLQNNAAMAKELFCAVSTSKTCTTADANMKLYEYERVGENVETTFNYIDSELEFIFQELCELLKQVR